MKIVTLRCYLCHQPLALDGITPHNACKNTNTELAFVPKPEPISVYGGNIDAYVEKAPFDHDRLLLAAFDRFWGSVVLPNTAEQSYLLRFDCAMPDFPHSNDEVHDSRSRTGAKRARKGPAFHT